MKNTYLNKSELIRKCPCAYVILEYAENLQRNFWIFDKCFLENNDEKITYISQFYNIRNTEILTTKCYLNEHNVYVLSSEVGEDK